MISVPVRTGDIAGAMIFASQMIYASRMKGTDIISCLQGKYITRHKPYIISRQRYIIEKCRIIWYDYKKRRSVNEII